MKKMLIIIYFFPQLTFSQLSYYSNVEKNLGTGYLSRPFVDVLACSRNPACLAETSSPAVGFNLEQKFLMKDVNFLSAAAMLPISGKGVGVQLSSFKNSGYYEWQASFSYGMKCTEQMMIGVCFGFHHVAFQGYGSETGMPVKVGLIYYASERLKLSLILDMALNDPLTSGMKVHSSYGMGYLLSEKSLVGVEVNKYGMQPIDIRTVLLYYFNSQFFIRSALSILPGNSCVGVGLKWKQYAIQLAVAYHGSLGLSPMFSVGFQPVKEKAN